MSQVTRAATQQEIAAAEARSAPNPAAHQVLPDGFEASKTVALTVPVSCEGVTYTEISIRRLKGRDFIRLQQMEGNEDVSLLAIATGLPAAVIEELDGDDFVQISEMAQDFLPRGLRQAAAQISGNGQASQA